MICHGTDSVTNPYQTPNVDISSATAEGHASHTGPVATDAVVAQALKDAHIQWGDIIPPFPLSGVVGGLNWTPDGIAIWNNGCKYVTPPATHKACSGGACTVVAGIGTDSCTTNANCLPNPTHKECQRNACVVVNGAATDSCSVDADCAAPTPTPTPTPTNTPNNPGNPGGPGDGKSDGRSSCPECTQAPKQGQVLGASTFAGTGTFDSTLATAEQAAGILLSAGAVAYAQIKTKKKSKASK